MTTARCNLALHTLRALRHDGGAHGLSERHVPFREAGLRPRGSIITGGETASRGTVGAWREANHDDLVLSVALAVCLVEGRKIASLAALREANGLAV